MAFFEVPETKKPPRRRRRRRELTAEAWQRPFGVVPRYLATGLVLASNGEVAIVMHDVACYPTGIAFQLRTVARYESHDDDDVGAADLFSYRHREYRGDPPPELLRFGVEYPNGNKATTLDRESYLRADNSDLSGPEIHLDGGGGGGCDWTYDVWVFPLPPPGKVTFACEWPAYGIPETTKRVDASRFTKAAEKAKPVF